MDWLEKQLNSYRAAKLEGDRLLEDGDLEDANLKLQEAVETLDRLYRREHGETFGMLSKCWKELVEKNLGEAKAALEEENYPFARELLQTALDLAQSKQQKDEIRIKLAQTGPERATTNLAKLFDEVESNPKDPEALYNFATELALEGYYPQAVSYLERLSELTPDDPDVQLMLANALADCDRLEEAESAYSKARGLGADGAEIDYRLGDIQLTRGDHASAMTFLERALAQTPEHLEAHRALAHLHSVAGEYAKAVESFHKVIEIDPDDSESHFELGNLHEIRGDMEAARKSWERAVDVDPEGDFAVFARDKLEASENEPGIN